MALELHGPTAARLALRGAAGWLWSDLHRPVGTSATALLVFFPDPVRPVLAPRALCDEARLAVLATRPACLADAVAVVEWAAEHATELGGDSARLLIGGEGAGAGLAAAVARHAIGEGWPRLLRQVLVHPAPDTDAGGGTVPATVVTLGDGGCRHALLLRHAGVAVEELAAGPDLVIRLGAALRRHSTRTSKEGTRS